VVHVTTQAAERATYLLRQDLGRRLSEEGRRKLGEAGEACDLSIVLSDGLSALATHRQIPAVLAEWLPMVGGLKVAPLVIAPLARVALEDEVGALQRARVAVILLGERPGLGSPDSLGAYLVHGPRVGRTDAERNCVSNIRPEGMTPRKGAELLTYLVTEALRRGVSGVGLKDERGGAALK